MGLEAGTWRVESTDDETGVLITISHMGEDGVESFKTAMLPDNAVEFAKAVVDRATWVVENAG